ncbi:MAG: hypothetical protein V3T67_05435 [Nitrosopumilaceae archaeon]
MSIFTLDMPLRKKGKHRRRADQSAARRRRKQSKSGKPRKR